MMPYSHSILWIDCETTGLDDQTDQILEVACILTDCNLRETDRMNHVIHHPPGVTMCEFARIHHHQKTARYDKTLMEECALSKCTIHQAEQRILDMIHAHVPREEPIVAGGSSVHVDLRFIRAQMPHLYRRLHYRILDASSLYQTVSWWCPALLKHHPRNASCHRAMPDIESTLAMMRYYQRHLFGNHQQRHKVVHSLPIRPYHGNNVPFTTNASGATTKTERARFMPPYHKNTIKQRRSNRNNNRHNDRSAVGTSSRFHHYHCTIKNDHVPSSSLQTKTSQESSRTCSSPSLITHRPTPTNMGSMEEKCSHQG